MQQPLQPSLILYVLVVLFSVLFLLQILAILRIKEMLQHVTEIIRFVRAGSAATRNRRPAVKVKPVCENCRYRSTYISDGKPPEFVFRCRRTNDRISLTHSCGLFEVDSQSEEI